MKRLAFALLVTGVAAGTPAQAQSRFDVCAAYARDAMMEFYSSSAVPVPRSVRSREAPRGPGYEPARSRYSDEQRGSLRAYFHQCWTRRL